ncbi:MAG TPA: class I SAM-dependent methyltransferase [Ferruginibacter sp.]|nr:class I SAM-dependent methyltransferase [Ferruginibacter sp.]HMP20532.1 class I SAM-dependent methyltransferase [Ferruginibacter sp.]
MPHCPLCNIETNRHFASATDVEYFTTTAHFDFYNCPHCDIVFIHPMPVQELAVIYPANYYSFTEKNSSLAFKIKDWLDSRFYRKILQQLPGTELKALDIGGGTGTLLDSLQKADKRLTHTQVVDIDSKAKTVAEAKGHQYYCGTIESFNTDGQYDVVLMLNLIEHVANPKAVLAKAAALLSPRGSIIIKTPNYNSLDARLFRRSYWGGLHCPRHWVLFTKHSFEKMADACGLQVQHFAYTQGAPFWAFSLLHWLHRRKWIKAGKDRPIIYHPLFGFISLIAAAFDFIRKPFAPLSQMFFVLGKKQ